MGGRNILVVSIAVMCLVFFALQNAGAKSKFQEYQDSLFAKVPVKPGDVVNKSNYQLIKDLVPKKFLEYVKNGQYVLTIGKYEYDAECDEEWMQASAKNRGKYDIHPKSGEIIEKASGKYPRYMYGFPFPTIDPKDTFAGSKILFNHKAHEYRGASTDQHAALALVGERTGFEREIIAYWQRYRYWCRPDGEQPNPAGLLSMQFTATLGPYDLAGTLNLLRRPL